MGSSLYLAPSRSSLFIPMGGVLGLLLLVFPLPPHYQWLGESVIVVVLPFAALSLKFDSSFLVLVEN